MAGLLNLGRHTITGSLTAAGLEQEDWSTSYRDLQRLPIPQMYSTIGLQTQAALAPGEPWVVAMDDSILRKSGRRIPGCGWRRDPLSPPFSVNFIWGQRVLQFSAAIPYQDGSARLIPVDFRHAPLPAKPGRTATNEQVQAYQEARKQANLNLVALDAMKDLARSSRPIHFVVDGRFTNKTLLRQVPGSSVVIGRIRKDTVLYARPEGPPGRGRPRRYGALLPTPEQLREDPSVPWQEVQAWAVDTQQTFRLKSMGPVRSRISGIHQDVRVVVIAPVGYRLRKGSKLLYRQPAYLICTDPNLPLVKILQEYLWRWDIEVNFRDEKTLLGVGNAQLRNPQAVDAQPAACVAAYAWLLLAAHHAFPAKRLPGLIPLPKWRAKHPPSRPSTASLINHLRAELWSHSIKPENLSHFWSHSPPNHNSSLFSSSLPSALFYASN